MTINERAAAMRQAWLGDAAGEAVAWNELKQCVRDRWLAVLDVAQPEVPPGVPEIKALREIGINAYLMHEQAKRENAGCIVGPMQAAAAAIRDRVIAGYAAAHGASVEAQPLSDEIIERMAEAARESLLPGVPEDDALAELEVVKAERDEYLRMYENEQKNADHWKAKAALADAAVSELRDQIDDDNTNAAAVNDLLIKLQNVTAERDRLVDENKQVTIDYGIAVKSHNRQQEARVACKNEVDRLVSQLAAVTAERDEARAEARAAIAHLRKRPEGLPTAEELKQVYRDGWNEGAGGDTCASGITAILAALAPWLREPVGWELDVTWQDLYNTYQTKLCGLQGSWEAILDLCRSRIHPTYECKECADKERRVQEMADIGNDFACKYELQRDRADGLAAKIASFARAALEGE